MQIFELHFNPKIKEDYFFDTFIYEPENTYEKKLGGLYIVGELQNSFRSDSNFLNNLAQAFKKNYYILSINSPEKALSHSSKKANEFLAEEVKKEHVNWLGNLNFAIFSLSGFNLNFTKTGDLKILLIRQGQIIDIGKNLDLQEIDPYPLKIFFNVISGKLVENDKILVLTKQIFDFFKEKNILNQIAKIQANFNSKKLREILPPSLFNKGEGAKISGPGIIAVLNSKDNQQESILFRVKKKIVPFEIHPVKLLRARLAGVLTLAKLFNRVSLSWIKTPKLPRLTIKKSGSLIERFKKQKKIGKNLVLIVILILILLFGFCLFKGASDKKEEKEIKISLEEIEKKVSEAENFLILKDQKQANSLLKEAWKKISSLTEKESSLKQDILSLKNSIEENLEKLNNLEKIENPEIVQELNPNQSEIESKKILFSLSGEDLIFSPPDAIFILKSDQWQETNIGLPSFDFNFDLFSSYLSNLYFLDQKTCLIVKYQNTGDLKWGSAKIWPKDSEESCLNPKSMAVDGSVWILNKDNSVLRYYSGILKETIKLDFFPYPKNISIIIAKPNLPYLYLLEPINKRVVIIDKTGGIIKQFQSENFNNLKDMAVSSSGKIIYLLNGSTIYRLKVEITPK